MHKAIRGLAGAAVLGFAALAGQSAQAQGFSITIGTPGYYGPPAPIYRPYPVYRPPYARHAYHPVYARPVYRPYPAYVPVRYGPRCTTEVTRYWDGWGWVSRRHRVCD